MLHTIALDCDGWSLAGSKHGRCGEESRRSCHKRKRLHRARRKTASRIGVVAGECTKSCVCECWQFTASEGETAGERGTREGLRRRHGGKRRGRSKGNQLIEKRRNRSCRSAVAWERARERRWGDARTGRVGNGHNVLANKTMRKTKNLERSPT